MAKRVVKSRSTQSPMDKLLNDLYIDKKSSVVEKKIDAKNKFKSRFAFESSLNRPIFKVFSDYFNILKDDINLQKKHEIKVVGFIRENEFKDNITRYEGYGQIG